MTALSKGRVRRIPLCGSLHRLVAVTALLVIFAPFALCESTYCAFEIRVTDPSGTALDKVPVYLVKNRDTTLASTTTDQRGVATFCDAPLGLLDIGVGFDSCGSAWVREVQAAWPETRSVFFTYTKTYCDHFAFGNHCLAVFRIRDETGHPVAGAQFKGGGTGTVISDAFGRTFRSTQRRGKLAGTITKPGYGPASVSETCVDDAEVPVVLHKQ